LIIRLGGDDDRLEEEEEEFWTHFDPPLIE